MTIEIKHRNTGAVLRTVHAVSLRGANLSGTDLSGAYLYKADLTGANLGGADLTRAYLTRADLSGADLTGAYLRGANLSGANLGGADLREADLNGAYLRGADLRKATIDTDKLDRLLARAMRLDGHEFLLFALQEGSPKIMAGCRWMTIPEYRDHVERMYPDTDKATETLDILNFFEARAR